MPRPKSAPPTPAELAALPTALARWMRARGVTCEQLAPLVNLTPVHLSRLRQGTSSPPLQTMAAIERATVELDRELGAKQPHGVPSSAWLPPATPATPARARRAGGRS